MLNDDRLAGALGDARRSTRDQVTAIWQNHVDRLRDAMSRDWREQIGRVIDDQFNDFEAALEPRILESRREVVRSFGRHWNECFNRMRLASSDPEWCDALLDAAAGIGRRCVFFSVKGETVCFQGLRGFDAAPRRVPPDIQVQNAPAFLEVVLSGVAAEASRTARDLSPEIAALVGPDMPGKDGVERAMLVPVSTDERVVGVLYVEHALEVAALEAIATVAGIVLSRRLETVEVARPSSVMKAVTTAAAEEVTPAAVVNRIIANPAAERAARVAASKLVVSHHGDIRAARAGGRASPGLQEEIDRARSEFAHPLSYLDAELARILERQLELVRR